MSYIVKIMFTLTDSAADKVASLIKQEQSDEPLFLRVAVRPGGCSGFSYEIFFDTQRAEDDVKTEFGKVEVSLDSQSAAMLENATMDYKDGLANAGFSISNPSAQRTCGCGQSFC